MYLASYTTVIHLHPHLYVIRVSLEQHVFRYHLCNVHNYGG